MLSKTAAIKQAHKSVSIHGNGTSWSIMCPYDSEKPEGPSTEMKADSYSKAQSIAARAKARVALALMGKLNDSANWAVQDGAGDVCTLVAAGLAAVES